MPLQFQTVEEPSFGRGIDARSAENQIRDGFVKDLVNADIVEGRVRKRKGHADFAGKIPLRVVSYRQENNSPLAPDRLYFAFDGSIDLARLTGSPLLVYGRSSSITAGGPFTTAGDTFRYYPTWFSNITKTIPACGPAPTYTPAIGTLSAPVSEHNISSTDIYVGVAVRPEGESITSLTNTHIGTVPAINQSTYEITVDYVNGSIVPQSTFIFYQDGRPVVGETFSQTVVLPQLAPALPYTIEISQATHQLNSSNIRYQLYKEDSGTWLAVKPDSVTVNQATGLVSITVANDTNTTQLDGNYKVLLAAVPSDQAIDLTYTGNDIIITGVDNPFILYTLYEVAGSTLSEVIPDEVEYSDTAKTLTFSFTGNLTPFNLTTLRLHYSYGTIRANELYVDSVDNFSTSLSDPSPQLTVYGLDHATIYGSEKEVDRKGWVTHLDSYRSPTTTHMVAGLGGNLFAALRPDQMYTSGGSPLPMLAAMPTYYPRLSERVVSTWSLSQPYIGPAFAATGSPNIRRRPVLTFNGGDLGWATVTSFAYDSGVPTYKLSVSGVAIVGTGSIADVISVVTGKEDYLTVTGMGHSRHNGTFKILSATLVGSELTLGVVNTAITSTDYDDNTCSGLAGIFTDQIELANSSPFLVDDILLSSAWGENVTPAVVSTSGSTVVVGNIFSPVELSPGLTIAGRRTSATIPLRTDQSVASSANIVVGDTVTCSAFDRPLQVLAVNNTAHSLTVDEAFTWEDNIALPTALSVAGRWIPAEVPTPDSSDVLLPKTTVQHLSANPYSNQPFLRSAMVQNNMYLTNGNDEVYKYDGYNFYRAGLIPWQPGLFLSTENVASGGIPLAGSGAIPVQSLVGGKLKLLNADAASFQVNDVVRFANAEGVTQTLTIASIVKGEASETTQVLSFKDTLDFTAKGTNPTLTLLYSARYAFRLNIRDINGVTTASAVTGAEDFVVVIAPETGKQTRVLLRLVGLPPWDQYDYRNKNIELEVYRTLWSRSALGEVPVFYRIQTVGLTYENNSGYIDIIDSYSNQTLTQTDNVVGVLSPDTVPADWDEPARAKYVTTTGNRLVLANVTDWPTLTLTYLDAGSNSFADFDDQTFFFKKDSNDSATDTNMVDRVRYEFRQASEALAAIPCSCTTTGEFKVVIPSITSTTGYSPGQWIYTYHQSVSSGNTKTFTTVAGSQYLFPTLPITTIANDILIHFETSNALPTGLTTTQGYYVKGQLSLSTTASNGESASATLRLASAAGFPTAGVVTANGQQYSYTGVSTNTLTGVSPPITLANGDTVSITGFSVTDSYQGTALTFTTAGTGTQTVLWDGSELDYSGWWQVHSVDLVPTVNYLRLTIKSSTSSQIGIPKQFPDRVLFATDKKDVPVLIGTDGNMGMFNGNGPLPWLVALRRLGMAINATMRVVDTTLPDYDDFVPWLIARSEGDTGGQLVVKQPRAEVTTVSLTLGGSGPARYVNGSLTPSSVGVDAVTTRYPSRLLVSYNNYPEIFDNPWTVDTDQSDSAIDINSADGQEITGVIPFFGESAFGASLQSGVLVVFKQNSIYLVDLAAKAAGQNSVQRLETQGLGCTAPYSIAPTKDGIAFANDSGIYVLRRNQRIEYLGRFVERLWQGAVRKDFLDIVQGHHYGVGRQYKLSIPIKGEGSADYAANSQVYVYNHTGEEGDGLGGWARYTSIPATGWANLFQDAFYANVNGSVLRLRNLDEEYDYRDGAEKIETVLETRAIAFGNTAIRKVVSHVTVHYRSGQNSDHTTVDTSTDLNKEYQPSTTFRVITNPSISDGLGTVSGQDVVSIMHSIGRRRCIYIAIKVTNDGINDNVEVAGISYTVSALSGAGVKQAAETD